MDRVANNSFRMSLIFFVALFLLLWGTSWEIPILGIPLTYCFSLLIIFSAIFLPKIQLNIKDILPVYIFMIVIMLYSILALPNIFSSDDIPRDTSNLLQYQIKMVIGFISIFVFASLFRSEKDIKNMTFFCSFFLFPLAILLYWRYKIVFDVHWLGVDISYPQKTGKNSFGAAIALLAPFLLINFKYDYIYKFFAALGVIGFIILLLNIDSRSMLLIVIAELGVFYWFTRLIGGYKKIFLFILLLSIITPILMTDNLFNRWVTKKNVNQVIVNESAIDTLAISHRFWLLSEAYNGFIASKGVGNGTNSYRIRPTNLGHRTETHNDYALILYEQGIIGFLAFVYLLINRIRLTIKILIKTRDPCVYASLSSMIGVLVALAFMNFYTSMLFWIIIGLNIAIVEIFSQQEYELNK